MGQGSDSVDQGDEGANEDLDYIQAEKRHKNARFNNAVNAVVSRKLKEYGIEPIKQPIKKKQTVRGKMVEVNCKQCKEPFMAREADRKRGWGKFCSKACKAEKQHRRNPDRYYD